MSESVGKISLDLEIQSDISKQVSNVSNMIGKNLKTSLNTGIKSALSGMNNSVKTSAGSVGKTINNAMKSSMGKMKDTIKAAFNSMKNIKPPKFEFPKPTNMKMPRSVDTFPTSSRGPPIDTGKLQDMKLGKMQTLDITDRQIENLRVKLQILEKQLESTFNVEGKNKIERTILSTESRMDSLINKSIKLSAEIKELDGKLSKTSNSAKSTSNGINAIDSAAKKATNSFKLFGNSTNKTNRALSQHRSNLGIIVRSMFTWGIVFPLVLRGLTALATAIGQGLMTNQQFANSFNQIKTNMQVAFTPILQAILPALNTLMAALAKATTYIASFISAIFGKTYQQSYQATQQLIDAKVAMGAYGDSAKKAAKDVKGLAAIDEINTLGATNVNIAGTNNKIPQLVAPPVDTSAVDNSMKNLLDRIKRYFSDISFTPLINSFKNLKSSVTPIVNNLGKILKWFMDNILRPLAEWTIEDALPAFFNLLSKALDILNPILEVFMDLGAWLWDSFLQPIASWTGGVIVDILNGLADVLGRIGDWISEHKPLVETFAIVLGSFALAWGLVSAAVGIANVVVGAWSVASGIATVATTALGMAIKFLTSPFGIAVTAIGAVIAVGALLIRNWDKIKETAYKVFGSIRDFITGVCGGIEKAFKGFINGVIKGLNFLIGGINKLSFETPSWIPGIGGKEFGFNIPKIPMLARGGLIDSPTLAMIGETHKKEAVVPLEGDTKALSLIADKLMEKLDGTNISKDEKDRAINIILKIGDLEFARVLIDSINKITKMNGGECLINI